MSEIPKKATLHNSAVALIFKVHHRRHAPLEEL
jgi:hypothetical protein